MNTMDAGYWRDTILKLATGLAPVVSHRFSELGDLSEREGSTLYAIGEVVAYEMRRRVLHEELVRTGWNLAHVADRLRFKSSGKVLCAIKAHGLIEEYERAKSDGVAPGKGRRPRRLVTK